MQFSRLLYAASNRIATITLNRPAKRNALDDVMIGELATAFGHAGRDQDVKVIVLRGSGSSFCAGADLEYLSKIATFDLEENRSDSKKLANLFRTIYELRKPIIAAVDGPALAGGCGLASACDFVIASDNASFGYTEVRIGFIPAIVMVFLIKRIGEGKARELVLRGNIITALEAEAIGLVNKVVKAGQLQQTVDTLSSELIQQNSSHAMGLCKEMLSKLNGLNLLDALDFAANMNAAARMTPDCRDGIGAFLNKEKIHWT
jgi:methylglutaconyl-CoA hydratase